jgi:hypothetical protein
MIRIIIIGGFGVNIAYGWFPIAGLLCISEIQGERSICVTEHL